MEPFPPPAADSPRCPHWATLADFNSGRLSEPELVAVADHVSTCQRCETLLRRLKSETGNAAIAGRLRDCLARPADESPPGYQALMAAAKALAGPDPSRDEHARPAGLPATAPAAEAGSAADTRIANFVGRYLVMESIGHGGMGVVYRAIQQSMNRTVALKTIRAADGAKPEAIARFRQEAAAVSRLEHPNVVRVYDFDEQDGVPYFVMELMGGGTLAEKIGNGLPVREAVEVVRAVAAGVAYAHDQKVIHRDLKPGNVLLAADGTPKVADFGLAKLLDETQGSGLTHTDAILGTPNYMAPEQAEGRAADVGVRTDVYALGAILYETLTGQPPFNGKSKLDTLALVRTAEPISPSRVRTEIPRELSEICLKCLEKIPSRRYNTAQTLADDLDRWLRNERPAETPRIIGRLARAARKRAVSLLAAAVILTGGAVAAGAFYLRDPDRPLREIRADFGRDNVVTLIGQTGAPKWFRGIVNQQRSHTLLTADGVFQVDAAEDTMLELLPETEPGRSYQFSAQIRHEKTSPTGCVGLYCGRQMFGQGDVAIHYMNLVRFDDIRAVADNPFNPNHGKPQLPQPQNCVRLEAVVIGEHTRRPGIDRHFGGISGPRFKPNGTVTPGWRTVSVTVTPSGVTAMWGGIPFGLTGAELIWEAGDGTRNLAAQFPNDPVASTISPLPTAAGGGLGLFLRNGSASFRSASVIRLPDQQ